MKLKKQKRISLICVIVLLLTTIVPNLALLETLATTATVTYHGTATYGGSTVGNFTVNGNQAFCIEHSKSTPPTGTAITSSIYDDESIAKCLYYRIRRSRTMEWIYIGIYGDCYNLISTRLFLQ